MLILSKRYQLPQISNIFSILLSPNRDAGQSRTVVFSSKKRIEKEIDSGIISGFQVHGFWAAILGSLVISAVNWLLSSFAEQGRGEGIEPIKTKREEDKGYIDLERKDDDTWV